MKKKKIFWLWGSFLTLILLGGIFIGVGLNAKTTLSTVASNNNVSVTVKLKASVSQFTSWKPGQKIEIYEPKNGLWVPGEFKATPTAIPGSFLGWLGKNPTQKIANATISYVPSAGMKALVVIALIGILLLIAAIPMFGWAVAYQIKIAKHAMERKKITGK